MGPGQGWQQGARRGRGGRHGAGAGDERPSVEGLGGWLTGRLPDDWFEGQPSVTVDRDEIVIIGQVAAADLPADGDDGGPLGGGGRSDHPLPGGDPRRAHGHRS